MLHIASSRATDGRSNIFAVCERSFLDKIRQQSLISTGSLSFGFFRGGFTLLVSVVGHAFGFLFFLFLYNGKVCGSWVFVCFFKYLEASKRFCTYFSTASKEGLDLVFCMLVCDFSQAVQGLCAYHELFKVRRYMYHA